MEYNIRLSAPYIRVRRQEGISFGGSQEWFKSKTIRDYGCGLIGAADVLLYLSRFWQPDHEDREAELELPAYETHVAALRRNFPILPGFGMPGWFLSIGFNRWFRKRKSPYRARWGVPHEQLMEAVAKMLEQDIPVILSAGPHFPKFWRKEGLSLYQETGDKRMLPVTKTRAHYVVVTALCGEWIQISSWGRMYYIRFSEYREYVRRYSCQLFSNICLIRACGQS